MASASLRDAAQCDRSSVYASYPVSVGSQPGMYGTNWRPAMRTGYMFSTANRTSGCLAASRASPVGNVRA
jgi:hypothetical protein